MGLLWDNAHGVDVVVGEVVATWDHLPNLQDDPASAAADLLAAQGAEALIVQIEEADFSCTLCATAKNLQQLECGHEFCRGCIPKIVPPVCPMCRRPL